MAAIAATPSLGPVQTPAATNLNPVVNHPTNATPSLGPMHTPAATNPSFPAVNNPINDPNSQGTPLVTHVNGTTVTQTNTVGPMTTHNPPIVANPGGPILPMANNIPVTVDGIHNITPGDVKAVYDAVQARYPTLLVVRPMKERPR